MNTNNKNPQRIDKSGSDNRSDTRKHQYKEHDDVLTNDANYDPDTQKYIGKERPEFDDKLDNEEKK